MVGGTKTPGWSAAAPLLATHSPDKKVGHTGPAQVFKEECFLLTVERIRWN
jgi:hypothetical protein